MKNAHTNTKAAAPHATRGHNAADNLTPGDCNLDETVAALPDVSYTDADLSALMFMIEEEKLAGDVYDALFEQTGLRVFDRIGDAEDQHMSTLLDQATTLGLNLDTVISLPAGSYSDPELQSLYDSLMLTASASDTAALEVGATIEVADIADLELAMVDLAGTPLGDIYANLLSGSNHHLAAFEGLLA